MSKEKEPYFVEQYNPIRSERSKAVCKQITKRLSFKCAYRSGRVPLLVDYYTKNSEVELAA